MAIIGIDLGTTHSLVSVWKDDRVQLIPNSLGRFLTPSVVSVESDGTVLIGEAARDRLITHPAETAAVFKRDMGTQKIFRLGKNGFLPEELSSFVLRSLKRDAEHYLGENVEEAVVSVPAYFNDSQRKATQNAGTLSGLKVERLVNEPTAAAIAYGLHERFENGVFLILDLGGGTFDVSLLEFTEGVMEVRAVAGDNRLGGEDFTNAIIAEFLRRNGMKQQDLSVKETKALYYLAEKCKFTLTEKNSAVIAFRDKDGKERELKLDREQFAYASGSLLERIQGPVEKAIRDSRVDIDDINDIVLAGGATRMPVFKDIIHRLFKRITSTLLNPDEVVCMGAGIQAGLKSRDKALKEIILTDICPYTLGTEVAQTRDNNIRPGYFLPVIERNSTIPISRVVELTTITDNQQCVKVEIYQGENRLVKNNIKLGSIEVNVPKAPAGEVRIELRYTYDINGLLEVDVHIPKTGMKKRLVIEENPGVLTKQEIERRLKELEKIKMHPRDQDENRAFIAKGERLWEQFIGEKRDEIGRVLATFEILLEKQDDREITQYRKKMGDWIDTLDTGLF